VTTAATANCRLAPARGRSQPALTTTGSAHPRARTEPARTTAPAALPNRRTLSHDPGHRNVDALGDRLVDAIVTHGHSEDIARHVHECLDAGADHVSLHRRGVLDETVLRLVVEVLVHGSGYEPVATAERSTRNDWCVRSGRPATPPSWAPTPMSSPSTMWSSRRERRGSGGITTEAGCENLSKIIEKWDRIVTPNRYGNGQAPIEDLLREIQDAERVNIAKATAPTVKAELQKDLTGATRALNAYRSGDEESFNNVLWERASRGSAMLRACHGRASRSPS
jgi:hypothetical protein